MLGLALTVGACAGGAEERPPPEDPTKPPGYVPPSAPAAPRSNTMTSAIVDEEGTKTFDASPERVFAATQGALRTLGYAIAFADPTVGTIKTEPKVTLTTQNERGSVGTGGAFGARYQGVTNVTTYAHAYAVTVTATPAGVRVRAAPRTFVNGEDASGYPVWELGTERTRWAQLFREIGSNLGAK